MAAVHKFLSERADKNAATVLSELLNEYVVWQHLRVAMRKLRYESQSMFKLAVEDDRDLIISARCAMLAKEWGESEPQYKTLHTRRFYPELVTKLKDRFDRYAILHVWDYQNPAACTFHVEYHRSSGGAILAAVETHIRGNFFAPEDFEAFVVAAAGRNETMRQALALLRSEPLAGTEAIPYLGENEVFEQILVVASQDKIAVNVRGTWYCRDAAETEDAARLRDLALSNPGATAIHRETIVPDRLLAETAWDLWQDFPRCAPRVVNELQRFWVTSSGSGMAVLVLDGLSLRELPLIVTAGQQRGLEPTRVEVLGSEVPTETDRFAETYFTFDRQAYNQLFDSELEKVIARTSHSAHRQALESLKGFDWLAYVSSWIRHAGYRDQRERDEKTHDIVTKLILGTLFRGYDPRIHGPMDLRFKASVANAVRNMTQKERNKRRNVPTVSIQQEFVPGSVTPDDLPAKPDPDDDEKVIDDFRDLVRRRLGGLGLAVLDARLSWEETKSLVGSPSLGSPGKWVIKKIVVGIKAMAREYAASLGEPDLLRGVERAMAAEGETIERRRAATMARAHVA